MEKNRLTSILSYSQIREIDLDSPDRTIRHSQVIRQKPFLRRIYSDWYTNLLHGLPERPSGPVVELGSGGGFCKDLIPGVITTEILPIPGVDILLDGQELPFGDQSLKGVVMVDVFHHLPRVVRFLAEAARCIKPGGTIVMIEPWNTLWSRLIYHHLHHEPFDPNSGEWEIPPGGPLSQANSALPWVVFQRDRRRFEKEYPQWQIKNIHLHTPIRYLLSGGVSMRSLMPESLYRFWRYVEERLDPFSHYLAMFATIILLRQDR